MVSLEKVPVIEVNTDNIVQLWPAILQAIRSSTFIALDTELSGLGNRKLLNAKDTDVRYRHMCEVASSRSMVALGISCFKLSPDGATGLSEAGRRHPTCRRLSFQVQTFNIMLLCAEHYVVEPGSLRFLVDHGFDFNLQYSKGLPYKRGDDKETDSEQNIRAIFTEIVLSKVPLVLHNAVIDLVFLYQNLYATLPKSQQSFIVDLADMFPAGLYDTKYVSDFKARMGASYLEYIFKKCQRDNMLSAENNWSHVIVLFLKYSSSDYVVNMPCTVSVGQHHKTSKKTLCMQYANHGWCPKGSACTKCHDIDVILDVQEQMKCRQKKSCDQREHSHLENCTQNLDRNSVSVESHNSKSPVQVENEISTGILHGVPSTSVNKTGSHRAGFDAFMTGFVFAFFSARYGHHEADEEEGGEERGELGMDEYKNKLYLIGKDMPLQVMPSSFAKPSMAHLNKINKIRLQST